MEQRKTDNRFEYAVLGALCGVFTVIVAGMIHTEKPEVLTVLGGALTLTIGQIGQAAQHLWGQSKKQPDTQRANTTTTTATTTTAPKVEETV